MTWLASIDFEQPRAGHLNSETLTEVLAGRPKPGSLIEDHPLRRARIGYRIQPELL